MHAYARAAVVGADGHIGVRLRYQREFRSLRSRQVPAIAVV